MSKLKFRIHKNNTSHKKGQVLLITVMLLAAAITVVMTIAFNSTTETQITKLEEESQKALSAAEAGLEAALQKKADVRLDELGYDTSGITGQAEVFLRRTNEYVTPLLQRDEQFIFYLADYDSLVSGPPSYWGPQNLTMYVNSEGETDCSSLELTFVDSADMVRKEIIDPCDIISGSGDEINFTTGSYPLSVDGVPYTFRTKASGTESQLVNITATKLVIVRVLNKPTRIGFTGTQLMPQGRTIISTAKTTSGVTKQVMLIQTFPQIPADFFVTSF